MQLTRLLLIAPNGRHRQLSLENIAFPVDSVARLIHQVAIFIHEFLPKILAEELDDMAIPILSVEPSGIHHLSKTRSIHHPCDGVKIGYIVRNGACMFAHSISSLTIDIGKPCSIPDTKNHLWDSKMHGIAVVIFLDLTGIVERKLPTILTSEIRVLTNRPNARMPKVMRLLLIYPGLFRTIRRATTNEIYPLFTFSGENPVKVVTLETWNKFHILDTGMELNSICPYYLSLELGSVRVSRDIDIKRNCLPLEKLCTIVHACHGKPFYVQAFQGLTNFGHGPAVGPSHGPPRRGVDHGEPTPPPSGYLGPTEQSPAKLDCPFFPQPDTADFRSRCRTSCQGLSPKRFPPCSCLPEEACICIQYRTPGAPSTRFPLAWQQSHLRNLLPLRRWPSPECTRQVPSCPRRHPACLSSPISSSWACKDKVCRQNHPNPASL